MTTDTTTPKTRALRLHRLDITPKAGGETTTRLVRAKTDRGAVAHVISDTITCRPATAEDAYALAVLGVRIESAPEGEGNAPD